MKNILLNIELNICMLCSDVVPIPIITNNWKCSIKGIVQNIHSTKQQYIFYNLIIRNKKNTSFSNVKCSKYVTKRKPILSRWISNKKSPSIRLYDFFKHFMESLIFFYAILSCIVCIAGYVHIKSRDTLFKLYHYTHNFVSDFLKLY